jgi:hypothetical protein
LLCTFSLYLYNHRRTEKGSKIKSIPKNKNETRSKEVSGINISGYPTDSEIRHVAHLLKPHRRGPGKTDPLKALAACQSLEAESQPPSSRALWKGFGRDRHLGRQFLSRSSPCDVIKALDPCALSGTVSASPDPCNVSTGAPDPLGILLPRSRDVWSPLARQGATRVPTTALIPTDGTDMTAL